MATPIKPKPPLDPKIDAPPLTPPKRIWPRWKDTALIDAIAAEIASGVSEQIAGQLHGLAESTVRTWLGRHDEALLAEVDGQDAEFVSALTPIARARARWFAECERMAAEGHAGRQWVLPRRLQSLYGQKQEVTLSSAKPLGSDDVLAALGRNKPAT